MLTGTVTILWDMRGVMPWSLSPSYRATFVRNHRPARHNRASRVQIEMAGLASRHLPRLYSKLGTSDVLERGPEDETNCRLGCWLIFSVMHS